MPIWEVIGGSSSGGIVVRQGQDTSSAAEDSRLTTGSLVKELQLSGERLHFELLSGNGPFSGWVSIKLKDGKELLRKTDDTLGLAASPMATLPGTSAWQILSLGNAGRAQQFRLLFSYAGVPAEEKRLNGQDGVLQHADSNNPVVHHGNVSIATIPSAMQYVGESLGLGVNDPASCSIALMLVTGAQSMRVEVCEAAFDHMLRKKKRQTSFSVMPYKKWLGHFERYLRTSSTRAKNEGKPSGPFVLGPSMCYADFALYDCLTSIWDLGCFGRDEEDRAQQYPYLVSLVEAISRLPALKTYGRPHVDHFDEHLGKLPAHTATVQAQVWEVISNAQGGILVRKAKDTSSVAETDRLATGALVRELELLGDRLHYQKLAGAGPESGWVSIKLKDKDLLSKTKKRPTPDAKKLPTPLNDGMWQVVSGDEPGRGQQVRLVFAFTGTLFDDLRLKGSEEKDAYKSDKMGDASPLAFDLFPIIRHGSRNIASTVGAMQYVGEKLGLGGDDANSRARAVTAVAWSEMMRNDVFFPAYFEMEKRRKRLAVFDTEPYKVWMNHFEGFFNTCKNMNIAPFIQGLNICYADLAVFDCVTAIWDLGCYGRDQTAREQCYPLLCAFVAAVANEPSLKDYGRPHAAHLISSLGDLPPPRTPDDEAAPLPAPMSRANCIKERLAQLGTPQDVAPAQSGNVSVLVASSNLETRYPGIAAQLAALINTSNAEATKTLPERKEFWHKDISRDEILQRFSMGDSGSRSNRALHVALVAEKPVGLISSTFWTPWTEPGVGHWGMLAVDTTFQGKKVASALVSSAMRRLAGVCQEAHIEYHHARGHAYSDRLKNWYEEKLGFKVVGAQMSGKDTVLRVCRKRFTEEEQRQGKILKQLELHTELTVQLTNLPTAELSFTPNCRAVFSKLATLVKVRGVELATSTCAAFQLIVYDVGPEGVFFVDLRPGLCFASYGEESAVDCKFEVADADLEAWLTGDVTWVEVYWSGRVQADIPYADAEAAAEKLKTVYGEASKA